MRINIDAINIRRGGGVTHLVQLMNSLNSLTSEIVSVTLWTSAKTAQQLHSYPWLNVKTFKWMEWPSPVRFFAQKIFLRKKFLGESDIFFSPGGILPNLRGVPMVTMSQNMLPFEADQALLFGALSFMRIKMLLLKFFQGNSFARADGVIFLTEYSRRTIGMRINITGNQAVIPHGVESRFMHKPKTQKGLEHYSNDNPFKFLYVSILMPYKHQVELAEAIFQLKNAGLPVEITFIGASDGSYGTNFQKLIKKLDPENLFLHWRGELDFEKLHQLYASADAFVFPSSCENLPNILIEAMASGLPIASSNFGPMPEILGEAGIYFNPYDIESIKSILMNLLHDVSLRERISSLAYKKAQDYSWAKCANETFDFILQVAKSRMD